MKRLISIIMILAMLLLCGCINKKAIVIDETAAVYNYGNDSDYNRRFTLSDSTLVYMQDFYNIVNYYVVDGSNKYTLDNPFIEGGYIYTTGACITDDMIYLNLYKKDNNECKTKIVKYSIKGKTYESVMDSNKNIINRSILANNIVYSAYDESDINGTCLNLYCYNTESEQTELIDSDIKCYGIVDGKIEYLKNENDEYAIKLYSIESKTNDNIGIIPKENYLPDINLGFFSNKYAAFVLYDLQQKNYILLYDISESKYEYIKIDNEIRSFSGCENRIFIELYDTSGTKTETEHPNGLYSFNLQSKEIIILSDEYESYFDLFAVSDSCIYFTAIKKDQLLQFNFELYELKISSNTNTVIRRVY